MLKSLGVIAPFVFGDIKMNNITNLISKMIEYEKGCPERVNHFLKVYSFAKIIAENEQIADEKQLILEVTSIVHDIGIKTSLEKYNSSSGKYQEFEGPPIAENILTNLGYSKNVIDRVCYLISNHHTYDNIDGIDYQILVEADFLVNIFENNLDEDNILNIKDKYFKTETGIKLLNTLYLA